VLRVFDRFGHKLRLAELAGDKAAAKPDNSLKFINYGNSNGMWFKNLSLLRLTEKFTLTSETLQERLETGRFQACTSLQPMSYGWVPPVGKDDAPLVHAANGCFMICAQREEKILPAQVINEVLAEKISEIEERKGTTVRKKERDALRDEIIHDLLPRAFSFSRRQYAYLDPATGWLIVDSASLKKTEELASWLRRSLESLPVTPPAVSERPAAVMTRWLAEEGALPADIAIENECELRATDEEGAVIRCKKHDLAAPEIQNHLEAGKEVVKIAVNWNDRLSFVLDETLGIKRLRFLDLVQEQAADVEAEDAAERFDADFSIMSGELAAFLPRLLELFGGENTQNNLNS
jgi:recombination associated protein RdgC